MSIGSLFSISNRRAAQGALSRAGFTDRISVLVRNLQRRRTFIRAARQAQANALVAGVASGAGLDSSGVRGRVASLTTQEQFGVFESRELQRFGLESAELRDMAQRELNQGQEIEGAVNAFVSIAGSS